ncbi:MAG: hypothetical protein PUF62_07310 [Bacteroidales bacterium]|nr:hypothetical protein [Bacteroidales bacterium]
MKYDKFRSTVLEKIVREFDNPDPGLFRGHGPYDHIISNPKDSKDRERIVNEYLLLPDVPKIQGEIKLHPDAHHMNSSQIMCYNFFRPLLKEYNKNKKDYKPSDELVDLVGKIIDTPLENKNSSCKFEYIQPNTDTTNFDFYLKCSDVEVFFEIKYTEKEFAKKKVTPDSELQYEKVYKPMISKAEHIFKDKTISASDFLKNFQLLRNAIRAIDNNKYVVFICPRAHDNLVNQYNKFKEQFLSPKGEEHVKLVTWESLLTAAENILISQGEFCKRYISILP